MTSAAPILSLNLSNSLSPHAEILASANINPETGLATDYLNHFNEAIMLLDMIPDMPDCVDDFLDWQPLSYIEHFRQSNFAAKELAIAAYDAAPSSVRSKFDELCEMLSSIIIAVRDAMTEAKRQSSREQLAKQAGEWLKPMVMRAGQIINGGDELAEVHSGPQADIDLIMSA